MKLFVWEEVFCAYTCGMVCILAHDLDEAMQLFETKYEGEHPPDPHAVKVIETPEAFAVWGGG